MRARTIAEAIREQEFISNAPTNSLQKDDCVTVQSIITKLQEQGLQIASIRPIQCATQIRLICGGVISVYTSGKVVVQGSMPDYAKLKQLEKVLPAHAIVIGGAM